MLMLMVSWPPPAPQSENTPDPPDKWMKYVRIFLLTVAAIYGFVLLLLVISFFRGRSLGGEVILQSAAPILAFPSDLAISIRRRVYRRLGKSLRSFDVVERVVFWTGRGALYDW